MRHAVALLAALLLGLSLGASAAHAKACPGYITAPKSDLGIIKMKAKGTTCKTVRHVAIGFDAALMGSEKTARRKRATVRDQRGRKWRCRITEHATGTEPGFIPYTSVACTRRSARIAFKFAS